MIQNRILVLKLKQIDHDKKKNSKMQYDGKTLNTFLKQDISLCKIYLAKEKSIKQNFKWKFPFNYI